MTSQLFRSVFVQRYRDVVPDVRSLCMEEMGVWLRKLPPVYLDDSYLKYVGWTLYDRVSTGQLSPLDIIPFSLSLAFPCLLYLLIYLLIYFLRGG